MTTSHPNFARRFVKPLHQFYIAMTGAYAISVLLFFMAQWLIGERFIVIELFNSFAHLLWIPALILLPFTLLIRAWRLALLLVPIVLILLFVYGGQFIPNNPETPENAVVLKVMTHNIYAGNRDVAAILNEIRSTDADFVAIQEITYLMADAFSTQLLETYPHQALHPLDIGVQGMGFLSKYPIEEDTFWQYEWLPTPLGHQRVQLQISATQSIVVYNVHPTHPGMNGYRFNPMWRSREIAAILEQAQTETLPVLLVGDFNMPHLSDDYQLITNQFEDVYNTVGWGMGWTFSLSPRMNAFLRLDYIFLSSDFVALESSVLSSSSGSDHHPVLATIALKSP